jgi:serine/threonine protein kinase/ABC-type amino acid transport substrate-binding protein
MANKTLGKYELLEELGRGGFGTVYRARDTSLEVERAVKVLHSALVADREFIERFTREARFAARLKHPHIVPVYDLGEVEGRFYLAMEIMPGGSLKDLLGKEKSLPYGRALQIMKQIGEALDYTHARDLVHRDVKPGNILFDEHGNAALSDLGFAKALSGQGSASLSSGGMLGTPAYMAPEVWRGKAVTPATDEYSLACVFYEMITGQVLFDGDSPPVVMTKHILDGPRFPEQWPEGVPQGMETVLGKALSREPKERYTSVGEFISTLEQSAPKEEHSVKVDEFIPQPEQATSEAASAPVQSEPQVFETAQAVPLAGEQGTPMELAAEATQVQEVEPAVEPLERIPVSPEAVERPDLTAVEEVPGEDSQEAIPSVEQVAEAEKIAGTPEMVAVPPPTNGKTKKKPAKPTRQPPVPAAKRKLPVWAIISVIVVGVIACAVLLVIILPSLFPPSANPVADSQIPATLAEPCPQSVGVILYWNANYDCLNEFGDPGYRQLAHSGQQNVNIGPFDNHASSVRIPSGWSVKLYNNENLDASAGSVCFNSDIADFSAQGMYSGTGVSINDTVSSMEVFDNPNCQPAQGTLTTPSGIQLPNLDGRIITVAVENAYPPFNSIDPGTGIWIGWDFDAVKEVCKRINCVPEFKQVAWDGIFPAMQAGEYDMLADGVPVTEERAKIVEFSIPYVEVNQYLLVRVDETRTIQQMKSDANAKIGTQIGTTNEIAAKAYFTDRTIQAFEVFDAAVLALKSGDIDGVVIDNIAGLGFMAKNEGVFKFAGQIATGEKLAFVFPPKSALKASVDKALLEMQADGTLNELNKKWGLIP